MNAKFDQMTQIVLKLDMWTQASILGSWNYSINSSALSAATRLVPNLPAEGSGIEEASEYNEQLRSIDTTALEPFVALASIVHAMYDDNVVADRELDGFDGTARFNRNLPARTATQFMAQYKVAQRNGSAPRMSARDYVTEQMRLDAQQRAITNAKSEDAVRLLGSVRDSGNPDAADERLFDTLEEKMIAKLKSRSLALELQRVNMRATPEARKEIEAHILFIDAALTELGETPVPFDAAAVAADNAAFEAELAIAQAAA